jgi:hypothetical protein
MDSNIVQLGGLEPYRQTVAQVLATLDTDAPSGLSQMQARERLSGGALGAAREPFRMRRLEGLGTAV